MRPGWAEGRLRLALLDRGGLPGGAFEEGVAGGLGQQRFDLAPQFRVVPAGFLEKSGALTGIPIAGRMVDGFHPLPSLGIHTLENVTLPVF